MNWRDKGEAALPNIEVAGDDTASSSAVGAVVLSVACGSLWPSAPASEPYPLTCTETTMATPLTLGAQAALLHLTDNGGVGQPLQLPAHVVPENDQEAVHEELAALNYIEIPQPTLSGVDDFCLTSAGARGAAGIRRSYPREVWRRRILEIVEDTGAAIPTSLAQDEACPSPGDTEQVMRDTKKLHDDGFFDGSRANGSAYVRAHLTELGEDCLASPYGPAGFIESQWVSGGNLTSQDTYDYSVHQVNSPGASAATGLGNASSIGNTVIDRRVFVTLSEQLQQWEPEDEAAAQETRAMVAALAEDGAEITKGVIASLIATAFVAYGPAVLALFAEFAQQIGF